MVISRVDAHTPIQGEGVAVYILVLEKKPDRAEFFLNKKEEHSASYQWNGNSFTENIETKLPCTSPEKSSLTCHLMAPGSSFR